jgi:hypothetical protein
LRNASPVLAPPCCASRTPSTPAGASLSWFTRSWPSMSARRAPAPAGRRCSPPRRTRARRVWPPPPPPPPLAVLPCPGCGVLVHGSLDEVHELRHHAGLEPPLPTEPVLRAPYRCVPELRWRLGVGAARSPRPPHAKHVRRARRSRASCAASHPALLGSQRGKAGERCKIRNAAVAIEPGNERRWRGVARSVVGNGLRWYLARREARRLVRLHT